MSWLLSRTSKRVTAIVFKGLFRRLNFVVTLLFARLLIRLWSWRFTFIVQGIVCLFVGVLFSIALRTIWMMPQMTLQKANYDSNSQKNIWMTFFEGSDIAYHSHFLTDCIVLTDQIFWPPRSPYIRLIDLCRHDSGAILWGRRNVAIPVRLSCWLLFLSDNFLFLFTITALVLPSQITKILLVLSMMLVIFLNTGSLSVENTLLVRYAPSYNYDLIFGSKFLLSFGFIVLGIYLLG